MTKELTKNDMIEEILKHQTRTNDFIFTKEKLESINFEILSIIYEASKHIYYTDTNDLDCLAIK